MNFIKSKLALGTVQFGLPYGVSNSFGKVPFTEVENIISFSKENGIRTLDTASDYGTSEQVLGEVGVSEFDIITKIGKPPSMNNNSRDWFESTFKNTLQQLNLEKIYGLLLHRPEILFESDSDLVYHFLLELKNKSLIDKIGISIYSVEELEKLPEKFKFDIVQAPFNILDRSLETSGWLDRLHSKGIEIHVRSAFLQGLLLFSKSDRPKKFNRWNYLWEEWHNWLEKESVSPLEACMFFQKSFSKIGKIIVGVQTADQLSHIVAALQSTRNLTIPINLISTDKELINPSYWNQL